MVKRMLILLFLLMTLSATALADIQVVDQAGLFTPEEEDQITQLIDRLEAEYEFDFFVYTSDQAHYSDTWDYANDLSDRYQIGMGPDDSGMLYLIDMYERVDQISTTGVLIQYLTDSRMEAIFDRTYPRLSRGDYGQAALSALTATEGFLRAGIEEGSFLYDAETGRRLSGLYNRLTTGELALAAVVGLIVAGVIVLSVQGAYTLKGSTYRYDLENNIALTLTRDDEQFLTQHVTRTARSSGTGSSGGHSSGGGNGSRVRVSSGGRSHGGGTGRHF